MANRNRRARRGSKTAASRTRRRTTASSQDAVALLEADHRELEKRFAQFDKARGHERRSELGAQICKSLRVHTAIEEEFFYPAFLAATGDTDLHHEAEVEHMSAKKLIAEIEASAPADEYYEARVKVLCEMIEHHVKEEEQPGGLFAKARRSTMDLEEIGARMRTRKEELMRRGTGRVAPLIRRGTARAAPLIRRGADQAAPIIRRGLGSLGALADGARRRMTRPNQPSR